MDEKKINQFISHQLVKAREEAGLTQVQVQKAGIIKQSSLSKIENGVKKITASKLYLLADHYEKSIEYFFKK